jgi:precorrin-6x reductase
MIDICIVCTYDAVKFAEALVRLLEAEQHNVSLWYGRQSLRAMNEAKATRAAVLLVWSCDAPSQHYMLEWANGISPDRLVEVARAPGAPQLDRLAPVIDFSQWRGERGGRAWSNLSERLRAVARVLEPPKPPPKQAILAMGLASVAAVGGAFVVRVNEPQSVTAPAQVALAEDLGIGGAVEAVEPASAEDLEWIEPVRVLRYDPIEASAVQLVDRPVPELPDIRAPTLLERLADLNPLRER